VSRAAFIDVWDVCQWMTQRFRERWGARLGQAAARALAPV
jgi:hypothetical protein